ncbi:MAG: hypothetical protein IJK28_12330 [Clostridia bacterium]|nr:hypothetical protein [Clostridia bacterium]
MTKITKPQAAELGTKPFATIRETSKRTGISEFELRKRFHEGRLPVIRAGTTILVDVPIFLDALHAEAQDALR